MGEDALDEQWRTVERVRRLGRKRGVPALLRRLPSLDPVVQFHVVAIDLPKLGGDSVFLFLSQTLRSHADARLREAAAYGLWWLRDERAHDVLLSTLRDATELPEVRGQVAETLGYLTSDARTRRYKEVARTLIEALADSSPVVRFWAAFALGSIRARAAVPALKKIVETDDAVCPRLWRVADEAADALLHIAGKPAPLRTPGPLEAT